MLNKKIALFLSLIFALVLIGINSPVFAQSPKDQSEDIPDQEGVYDVPNQPKLKLRVFVHNPKTLKNSSTNTLVCNLPDPDSNVQVPPVGWHLPSNWTYQLNPGSVPSSVGSDNLSTFSSIAFDYWRQAANNKVNFNKGSDTTVAQRGFDGKNIIAWGKTSGNALATTYTWYYPSTGLVAEVDTIMNKRFTWSWMPYSTSACVNNSTYDAQDILTHELGHWLGLDDTYTSNFADNTMFGYGSPGEIKKDTLTTGDKTGVAAIYP